jgi:hypothetical protein
MSQELKKNELNRKIEELKKEESRIVESKELEIKFDKGKLFEMMGSKIKEIKKSRWLIRNLFAEQ